MRWRILSKIKAKKATDRQEEIVKILFKNRGLRSKKQQQEFLQPKDPYKLTPKDVGISPGQLIKAVKRIKSAIKNKEKVIVYGDYDTDGVCATAIIWEALNKLGAEAMPFIPKREEGYGLKVDRIDQMAKGGVKLIVAVDQGIVHSKQVAHAKKVGVDVIVTDHHLPGEKKPKAVAIVHTIKLAGSGVAWFLAKNLHLPGGGATPSAGRHLGGGDGLDLAAIGTITDMVPLLGPNRSIVKFGLAKVRKTRRKGLLSLYDFAGVDKKKIDTYEIGFIIGPRLNAAGRMDDPMESLRLICTHDENRAIDLAQKIDQRNRERQALTDQTFLHARELWLKEDGKSALIFLRHQSYQEGIVGLVAAKLMEEFYRPVVIVSQGRRWSKASARSVEEFNIVEAIRACADILGAHGGHPRAAGFSVQTEKLDLLKQRLITLAEKQLDKAKLMPTLKVDTKVNLKDLSFELFKQIEKFTPFGMENPQPVFASLGVKVLEAKTVGSEDQHLKLRVTSQRVNESPVTFDAIGFGRSELYNKLFPGKLIDIAYNLLLDEWNNQKRLQLRLKDIKI